MPPEHADSSSSDFARPDFTSRMAPHQLPEWMDEPWPYEELRACLHDLAQVNRVTLGYRPTLRFLDEVVARKPHSRDDDRTATERDPLRIVDVGSGGGDTLRAIERWAKRRRIPVQLTGVDLNPHAARAAREFTSAGSQIRWVTADVFSYLPSGGIDLVISSLFTHHLEETDIVRFLAWMERIAVRGWFVNDLQRSRKAFLGFRALACAARWHSFVRHDGPVSIRRAFREQDWKHMLAQAGVPLDSCEMESGAPGRLCVSRCK